MKDVRTTWVLLAPGASTVLGALDRFDVRGPITFFQSRLQLQL